LLSRIFVDHFREYAVFCFREFGDQVQDWITFNEPFCSCVMGFVTGEHAPGHTRKPGTEPYLAAHHILLAHAAAYRAFQSNGFTGRAAHHAQHGLVASGY
jgi:beta-glucosidase/6-phospho-beta-glucosidase/beta-galactosidase